MRRAIAAAIVAAILVVSSSAVAEPTHPVPTIPTQIESPMTCESEAGTRLELPANFWLIPPAVRDAEDAEFRRLQESEVRNDAENQSLRRSVHNTSVSAKLLAGTALLLGFLGGAAYQKWGR